MYKKIGFLILFFTVSLFAYTGDNLGNHKGTKDLDMDSYNIKYTPYKAFISKDYNGTEIIDTSTDIIAGINFVSRALVGFTRSGSSLTYTGLEHDFLLNATICAANTDSGAIIHYAFTKNGVIIDGTIQHIDYTAQDKHQQITLVGIVEDLVSGDILAIVSWAVGSETIQIEHAAFVVTQND